MEAELWRHVRAMQRRFGELIARALANAVWASATAKYPANAAWAFATASQLDVQLLMTLARAAERHMANFNPQDLANTAWAFATAN